MDNKSLEQSSTAEHYTVMVCQYRSCLAKGSEEVLAAFQEFESPEIKVIGTGCQGQCSSGPTVRIVPGETWYCLVQPHDVPLIVEQHLQGGMPVEAKLHPRIHLRFSPF